MGLTKPENDTITDIIEDAELVDIEEAGVIDTRTIDDTIRIQAISDGVSSFGLTPEHSLTLEAFIYGYDEMNGIEPLYADDDEVVVQVHDICSFPNEANATIVHIQNHWHEYPAALCAYHSRRTQNSPNQVKDGDEPSDTKDSHDPQTDGDDDDNDSYYSSTDSDSDVDYDHYFPTSPIEDGEFDNMSGCECEDDWNERQYNNAVAAGNEESAIYWAGVIDSKYDDESSDEVVIDSDILSKPIEELATLFFGLGRLEDDYE